MAVPVMTMRAASNSRHMAPRARPLPGRCVIGEELLLAVDLEGPDRPLAFCRQHPIDEGLTLDLLHSGMLARIDEDDAILVEELVVALDRDLVVAAILEARPCGAVGEHVGAHADGSVDGRAHAGAGLPIPAAGGGLHVDARILPQPQLRLVGTAIVAARDERGFA